VVVAKYGMRKSARKNSAKVAHSGAAEMSANKPRNKQFRYDKQHLLTFWSFIFQLTFFFSPVSSFSINP